MSTKFTQTKEQLLDTLEGEQFYSVMLQDTVTITGGKVFCKNSKLEIPEPTQELIGTLVDELFINEFGCYPTDENIQRIFVEKVGQTIEQFFKIDP